MLISNLKEKTGQLHVKGTPNKRKSSSIKAQLKPSSSAKYYVQVGAYAQKENAEKQLQKARDSGFVYAFIKEF